MPKFFLISWSGKASLPSANLHTSDFNSLGDHDTMESAQKAAMAIMTQENADSYFVQRGAIITIEGHVSVPGGKSTGRGEGC